MTNMFIKKTALTADTDLCSIITCFTIPCKRITVYFGTMYNKSIQHITKGLCKEAALYHHTHTYILQVKSPTSENHQLSVPWAPHHFVIQKNKKTGKSKKVNKPFAFNLIGMQYSLNQGQNCIIFQSSAY